MVLILIPNHFTMKQLALIFALFLVSTGLHAQQFETNFETAQANSQSSGKPIVLVFSGSDWCKPCILLKQNILATPEFSAFSDEKLVTVNLDFPYRKKNLLSKELQAQNEELAEIYNPKGTFPLVILLNEDMSIAEQFDYHPKMEAAAFIQQIDAKLPQ